MNLHPRSPAHIFIVRRLIYVLKTAPSADIENQYGLKLCLARKDVCKKSLQGRTTYKGEAASTGI